MRYKQYNRPISQQISHNVELRLGLSLRTAGLQITQVLLMTHKRVHQNNPHQAVWSGGAAEVTAYFQPSSS